MGPEGIATILTVPACVHQVQQRMQRLKEKLFQDVTNALQPSRQHPPGRWQEAWYRAGRFLNRRPGHSQAQELELQNKLYELHAAISSSLEAEVRRCSIGCTGSVQEAM